MALTRRMLKAMGIDEEKIDQIIDAHTETVDALKADRDKLKEEADMLPVVQKELDKVKAATNDGKNAAFEVKYNALKEEFDKFKKDIEQRESNSKKESAYRALLKEAGISDKRIDAVLRVSDLSNVRLDAEGKIEGAAELKKAIREEWSDFIVTEGKSGAETPTPPSGGGKVYKTKEEIMAIKDTGERQKAIADNHELFGF